MNPEKTTCSQVFMEQGARTCSMDSDCIMPEYLYRMWGESVPLEEIEEPIREVRRMT